MLLRAAYEVLKAVWGVLTEFGVSGAIIGGTSALLIAGWASMQRQEWWFLTWVALTTFAAVLAVYVIVRVYIRTWRNLPHYEQWDLVDPIPIWQAACLWAGKSPKLPVEDGKEYAYFTAIKAAIDTHRLQGVGSGSANIWTKVYRAHLRDFIDKTQERPAFIFKESRR